MTLARGVMVIVIGNGHSETRSWRIVDFTVRADPKGEINKQTKERQVLRSFQRIKKAMEDEDDGDTNCNQYTRKDPQSLVKGSRRVGLVGCSLYGILTFDRLFNAESIFI